ncbi:MAG: 4-hydroxythreonine-4-phosphate dehydrogenase [Bacteroidetes bacterium]|nr:MAG: 4-hydroxythreonine-4-phosphate dehydrogenase [Bacteroidota bacterium]
MSDTPQKEQRIRVGISQGDINGIGLEVIMKTLNEPMFSELCTTVLFSSQKTTSVHRKALGLEEFNFNIARDLDNLNPRRPNLINVYEDDAPVEFGKANPAVGKYALLSLEAACAALQQKKIDILVTAPINKHTIQSDEFRFAGHTEYLQEKFGAKNSLMLMVNGDMRVGLLSGHVPLQDVAQQITVEKIIDKVRLLNKALVEDFGIRRPKIAILGLNPHAGDQGTLGQEEQQVILPAIEKLKEENLLAFGPYAADGFFGAGTFRQFDAVLAMYHDQGLAPFKALAFHGGVNYTAGLPVIRTSPDHGTGYDMAGKNQASEESFRNALYLAIDAFRIRNNWAVISANPLKIQPIKPRDRDR